MEPIALRGLAAALGLDRDGHHHVAVVGGGGKTTVVHALGTQLRGTRVITCTTKMGHDQHRGLPVLLDPGDDELVDAARVGPVVAWQSIRGHKAVGVAPERCDHWFGLVDHVVAEADGSRQRPFKAPSTFEPVVAETATLLVSVIGADALGRVIADQCHRPLRVAALAECSPYVRLSPAAAATVLLHERGARKAQPPHAAFAVVVNKVDAASRPFAEELQAALAVRSPQTTVALVAFDAAVRGPVAS